MVDQSSTAVQSEISHRGSTLTFSANWRHTIVHLRDVSMRCIGEKCDAGVNCFHMMSSDFSDPLTIPVKSKAWTFELRVKCFPNYGNGFPWTDPQTFLLASIIFSFLFFNWNIITTVEWIAENCSTEIKNPWKWFFKISFEDFLTFRLDLVPASSLNLPSILVYDQKAQNRAAFGHRHSRIEIFYLLTSTRLPLVLECSCWGKIYKVFSYLEHTKGKAFSRGTTLPK